MEALKDVEVTQDLREVPPIEPAPPSGLPTVWAWFAGLIGPLVVAICMAVEPAPADPAASIPALDSLLFLGLLATLALAAGAAVRRQVRALTWAAAASGVALALSVACPASGHHTDVGAWWYTQMAAAGAALAVATVARSRFRTAP